MSSPMTKYIFVLIQKKKKKLFDHVIKTFLLKKKEQNERQ